MSHLSRWFPAVATSVVVIAVVLVLTLPRWTQGQMLFDALDFPGRIIHRGTADILLPPGINSGSIRVNRPLGHMGQVIVAPRKVNSVNQVSMPAIARWAPDPRIGFEVEVITLLPNNAPFGNGSNLFTVDYIIVVP